MSIYLAYSPKNGRILFTQEFRQEIPEDTTNIKYILTSDFIFPDTAYVENSNIISIPLAPNEYSIFDWETKQWNLDPNSIILAKTRAVEQINQLASQKILPKYPIYYQLNAPYDFGQDSPEVQEMRTWIDSIRTLANTAKAEIASATTLPEITTIVDNFKTELGNIT